MPTETTVDSGTQRPAEGKTPLPSERTHREIGGLAVWTVTSAKPGNGVELLRDNRTDTYWQSDGLQPHLINLQFQRRVKVSYVAIALDYKLDESYTPSKMSIRAGTGYHDLKELKVIDVNEPIGWQVVQLEGANPEAADFVKAYFIQVAIISNHQNGRDTHVRQIKVFGPRQDLVKAMGHEIGFTSAEFAPYAVVR